MIFCAVFLITMAGHGGRVGKSISVNSSRGSYYYSYSGHSQLLTQLSGWSLCCVCGFFVGGVRDARVLGKCRFYTIICLNLHPTSSIFQQSAPKMAN